MEKMEEKLRTIAKYINYIADDIADENRTSDDWCSNKMGLDIAIYELNQIAEEMSKHYD